MIKFPSINQYRDVIREVKRKATFAGLDAAGEPIINHAAPMPKLSFRGSVKLHGTNGAIVYDGATYSFQSRERELTTESDNAGFCAHMVSWLGTVEKIREEVAYRCGAANEDTVAIFGEWCGGNIQRGVALNGLPKMFIVFAIKLGEQWQDIDKFDWLRSTEAGIYCITQFPQWDIEIDFSAPELKQNDLGALTEAVEKQCPVALAFGNDGIGEGIVWRCMDNPSSDYWFKVKGEKHSASKVKTLAAVDVEAVQKAVDFVAMAVTEQRLEQGLQNLINEQQKPLAMSSIGDFIRWVCGDVFKEESDTIAANGLDQKKLGGPISQAAKQWFFKKLDEAASAP